MNSSWAVLVFAAAPLFAQPRIDSVTPSQGAAAGGTIVTLKGANLSGAMMALDGNALVPLSQADSEVRLQLPAHDNGYGVITARAGSAIAYGEFLYLPPRLQDLPPGFITTIAGVGTFLRDFGPAANASLYPAGLAFDRQGTLYIAEPGHDKISRVKTDGTIERVTATGSSNPGPDNIPAVDSQVSFPLSVAVDPQGNLYIPDHFGRLRRVDAITGIITTLAGDGTFGATGNVGLPTFVAADDRDLFFTDFRFSRIGRIHLADGVLTTYAGTGVAGFSGDGGPATAAQFNLGDSDKGHLALDPQGNLYLADSFNFRIRRIDRQTGVITTFYSLPHNANAPDGVSEVRSLAFDAAGNCYYGGSGRIVKLNPQAQLVTSWGNGTYALLADGMTAANAGLGLVTGLAIDSAGNVVFSDDAIHRVMKIDVATGLLKSVAGIGPAVIGENGPALATTMSAIGDLAFDRQGRLLFTDGLRLRRIDSAGNVSTVGGTGSFIGKFPPAQINEIVIAPGGVDVDRDGNLDLADSSVIRRVDSSGAVRDQAGRGGICGYAGDGGAASSATICQAWDTARDGDGNLFIADTNNNRIRRVDAKSGVITTVVGNGGPVNGYEHYFEGTFCGDGGPALQACLNTPYGVTFDAAGDLFISEGGRIRKVDRSGIISTFIVNAGFTKMLFDSAGLLYGVRNDRVLRFDRAGAETILAGGTGSPGFKGDGGPALAAMLNSSVGQAIGIAIDSEGNLFFIDSINLRIRAVRYGAVLAPPNATIRTTLNGSAIRATVSDRNGAPAPGVRVDFTAPASGASCILSSPFAVTDANGVATVTCTSNCAAGSYSVSAQPLTSSSKATVAMMNAGGPCRRRAARH